jgi:hypothetical protein
MASVTMSTRLLFVIDAVQKTRGVAVSEGCLGISKDWLSKTREYFFSLPDDLIAELGLKKNELCLMAILDFKLSNELTELEDSALSLLLFGF